MIGVPNGVADGALPPPAQCTRVRSGSRSNSYGTVSSCTPVPTANTSRGRPAPGRACVVVDERCRMRRPRVGAIGSIDIGGSVVYLDNRSTSTQAMAKNSTLAP